MNNRTITGVVRDLAERHSIPASTFKANSRLLRELNLISFGNGSNAKLTAFGAYVAELIADDNAK